MKLKLLHLPYAQFSSVPLLQVSLRAGAATSPFLGAMDHTFFLRPTAWILMILVSVSAMLLDIITKVLSNMFCPTERQIHMEIQSEELHK